uniref:Uncharacterized protein n=1 Tax=Noctiluca scintillans TaxID=2966 RepID=A0A7S0ZPX8_NOCSC|mmetsp:Transcript_13794/g.37777  ORF Transcript_13794/g.37777 Transcript_13794/m.37777 type:complete len:229 (+) Transcript_13794:162-848(+)
MPVVPFLSFNDDAARNADFLLEKEDEAVLERLREPIMLKDKWVLWEQVVQNDGKNTTFTDALKKVVSFSQLHEFWRIWNGLPQPSDLLDQKQIMRDPGVAIDAIMIFKEGIKPEWEDPMNSQGGHFQIQLKPNVGAWQIDEYWNNIVMGMIGGTIEPSDMITGIRLVDKLSGPKGANAIRIELWWKRDSEGNQAALKKSMEKCMSTKLDGSAGMACKAETKQHTNIKH